MINQSEQDGAGENKARIGRLELNRETLQELTEGETERARGGALRLKSDEWQCRTAVPALC